MGSKKLWENLQIKDDFIFAKVMRDKHICMQVLEKLLQTKIDDIKYLEEQKTIDVKTDAKSVRLDVYVEDGKRIFNLEMQTTSQKDLPKRIRYYQSMIDLNNLEKGETYKRLKESFIIFICTFDAFGEGRPKYTFENYCSENKKLKLGDGTTKIFFNTTAYDKADTLDIRDFLEYVNGGINDNPLVAELATKVEKAKESEEWRLEYMTLSMMEQEAKEQGIQEAIKIIVKRFRKMLIPDEVITTQIMEDFQITEEEAKEYMES